MEEGRGADPLGRAYHGVQTRFARRCGTLQSGNVSTRNPSPLGLPLASNEVQALPDYASKGVVRDTEVISLQCQSRRA